MKYFSKCLYGILVIVCFASCSKKSGPAPTEDNNDDVPQDTLVVKLHDTLLSKAIIWDSTNLGATAFTQEYVFDDQKRVKMIVIYNSDTNGVQLPAAKTDTTLQCFYNGAERNAYRTIGYSFFYTSAKGDVLHFYNSNNQIVKDSLYSSPTSYRTRTYTYLSDELITYDVTITNILPPGYKRDTFQVINNNIAHAKFAFAPGIGYDVFDLVYDNKINPLTKLNIASNILLEGGQAFDKNPYLSPGYCKNNMTQRIGKRSQSTAGSSEIDKFQYIYNEIDLPIYCKISYSVYTNSSGRVKYVYTH
jgi:hypothetical protein